jgi:hypothetical protein
MIDNMIYAAPQLTCTERNNGHSRFDESERNQPSGMGRSSNSAGCGRRNSCLGCVSINEEAGFSSPARMYNFHMLPLTLRPFFWDIDTESFEPQAYPDYTIERILEIGTPEAIEWLEHQFSEEQIKVVIRTTQRLSPKSANFWALVYHIPPQEVAALR